MDVDIFIPCIIDQFYPETGFNMVKILEKVGVVAHYNPKQTCCGRTAFYAGHWDEARLLGEKFIAEFSSDRPVVAPSAACMSMVKNQYSKLFHNTSLHIEYRKLSRNAFEFTDFLVNQLNIKNLGARFPHKVMHHESCIAKREYGNMEQAQILLSNVKDIEVLNIPGSDESCGGGGSFTVTHEAISGSLAKQTVDKAIKAGAEYIIVEEPSCLQQLKTYVQKQQAPVEVIHLVDVLANGWEL